MKARKKVRKSTPKQPTSRRKLANKVNRSLQIIRKISKRSQKKFQKKKKIKRAVRMINNQLTVNNATNENDAQQPSTSGQSTSRNNRPNKPFVKFRDDKVRHYPDKHFFVKKYKANKRPLQPLSRFPITNAPSPSQLFSRKILRTIRKRRLPLGEHIPNKTPTTDTAGEIHKDFQKTPRTTEIAEIDDDCVCIEPLPEVILIDDEVISPIVGTQEDNDTNEQKLKPYEPIGSIRSGGWPSSSMEMLTSTPKFNGFPFKGGPLGDFASPSLSRIEDCALREKEDNGSAVIVIDDTVVPSINRSNGRRKQRHDTDDSVIFVCENVASDSYQPTRAQPTYAKVVSEDCQASEFIPLVTPADESQYKVKWVDPTPVTAAKRPRNELFNSKEQQQIKVYNENAYNPNGDDPALHTKKRMVIIDGSNVAYQHALNKEFSVKGLKICLDYFEKMGHDVKAVVPQFRLRTLKSSDPSALEKLHKDGKIVFTPCKNLPGKSSISYDDRFVLQLATELDAAVVSNDNYRDLINENPAFKKIIENRVIGYTWCNDLFILPKDPYGKWGPTLTTILNRS